MIIDMNTYLLAEVKDMAKVEKDIKKEYSFLIQEGKI